ncbi:MAG: hypothetical protein JW743_00900 [Deltaproteobacteria bacterium]|nr:hypothetical protein [Deltaproteobacteria bacterium]MBN2846405.1 hypothetical protein [Deltaproteobacteria bacterium]
MKKGFLGLIIIIALTFVLSSCGGIRYSKTMKGAEDFHPKSVGIIEVRAGGYPEVKGTADEIVTEVLSEKKWFSKVISEKIIQEKMASDDGVKDIVDNYLMKLEKVSYSDPELSRKIGEIYAVDALLVVTVDFWTYTTEGDDKVAKGGFSMDLVEAASGRIIWKAAHHKVKKYKFFEPDLSKLAKSISKKMITQMPH